MTQSLPTPVGLKNEFTTSSLNPNVGDSPTASGNWKLRATTQENRDELTLTLTWLNIKSKWIYL